MFYTFKQTTIFGWLFELRMPNGILADGDFCLETWELGQLNGGN